MTAMDTWVESNAAYFVQVCIGISFLALFLDYSMANAVSSEVMVGLFSTFQMMYLILLLDTDRMPLNLFNYLRGIDSVTLKLKYLDSIIDYLKD